jgi:uncharacterized RDD family membrane protein YckC/Tfp pilus assembly major pilin PilA
VSQAAYTPPIDQPPPLPVAVPYGGFWVRFAAHFVDGFIIWVLTVVLVVIWVVAVEFEGSDIATILWSVSFVTVGQFYHAYYVSSAKMATPGKRLCGLYVTDVDGHRLSFVHALGRNVAALLSYLTLYIGFFMAGLTERRQALHDKLAGTLVHRQPGSSPVWVVLIVVGVFLFVALAGIIAAVAIPAFDDYGTRAKMAGVLATMREAREPIAIYEKEKGAWPTTWEQVQFNPLSQLQQHSRPIVEDIRLERGGVVVTIVKIRGAQGQVSLTPRKAGEDLVEWTCTSSPEIGKYMPASCRP